MDLQIYTTKGFVSQSSCGMRSLVVHSMLLSSLLPFVGAVAATASQCIAILR